MKRASLFLLIMFCLSSLFAQPVRYSFKHVDSNLGLSNNQINTVFKDSKGYVWIGTINGLNRFDGFNIKVFQKEKNKPASLPDNNITAIYEDHNGIIWVVTVSGLVFFDPVTEKFSLTHPLQQKGFPSDSIVSLFTDSDNCLWLVHSRKGVFKYNAKTDKVTYFDTSNGDSNNEIITGFDHGPDNTFWWITNSVKVYHFDPVKFSIIGSYSNELAGLSFSTSDYRLMIAPTSELWLYSLSKNEGAFRFDPARSEIIHFHINSPKYKISNNIIAAATTDSHGNIWLGTDHGGINVVDKNTLQVTTITSEPGNSGSLSQNSITTLLTDNNGTVWAGTYKKGVNYSHPNFSRFSTYKMQPSKDSWLTNEDVNTFAETRNGNLWIGTNGGGLLYFDRKQNSFKTYYHIPSNSNSLSNNVIVDILVDKNDGLWIGTYTGGLNFFDGKNFQNYMNNPNNPESLPSNNIWSLFQDSKGVLWVGTLNGGICTFNPQTKTFTSHINRPQPSPNSNFIMSIAEGKDGNMWFATSYGLQCFVRSTGQFVEYLHNENNENSLVNNSVLDVFCDSRGWVWSATRGGLSLFKPNEQKFTSFGKEEGLPDNHVQTILEADNGTIWVATPQGLSNIIIDNKLKDKPTFTFKNYNEQDGLHGREFNEHAALKTRSGELVFGGPNGFSIFDPEKLTSANQKPTVVFTQFVLENKPIEIGQEVNNRVLLPKTLNSTSKIELKYFEKSFSVSFAALNYLNSSRIVYHYILEGFNNEWLKTGLNTREVAYTNLGAGDYSFKVYAEDLENGSKCDPITLKIKVLPPFWKTKWAFAIYVVLLLFIVAYTVQTIIQRERNKYLIQQERLETAKVHEMDMLKLKFFTNISHEFRTPLTLILTPLERIIKTTDEGQNKEQLKLIQRNGKRLLNLVNQLLDFRRLEMQGLTLDIRKGEIVSFCKDAIESFSDLSGTRNIHLVFETTIDELVASFDFDKVEKIIFNLLSNAFKFTPENGTIKFSLSVIGQNEQQNWLLIEVSDTGIGIPSDKQEAIFERFVQNVPAGVVVNKGSGIGLSLTREFVQMHEGTISLKSEPGKGSCFSVKLPLKDNFKLQQSDVQTIFESNIENLEHSEIISSTDSGMNPKKCKLLLVEDNSDIRFYLKDNLKQIYNIVEAENGERAWETILTDMPDLVVSDIMMPVMDGIALCEKIKTDRRTSHIPVVLLTARTSDQHKLEGLGTGADDYLTKPFNFEVLELKIRNLIEQRERMRQMFQKNFDLQPSEINVASLDEKFLKKVKEITEKNIHEPNFSVEKLSYDIGISRAHLYNKLLALTGKTPIEYIRILRIRRAAQLLEKSQLTVMEVAFKVGFNDPRYFTKHFKSEYNMTPSQYVKQFGKVEKPDTGL